MASSVSDDELLVHPLLEDPMHPSRLFGPPAPPRDMTGEEPVDFDSLIPSDSPFTVEQRQDFVGLLKQFPDCFGQEDTDVGNVSASFGCFRPVMKDDYKPFREPTRRFSPVARAVLVQWGKDQLAAGLHESAASAQISLASLWSRPSRTPLSGVFAATTGASTKALRTITAL